MKSTTLVALLTAHFGASYAQWDCRDMCRTINIKDNSNACGPTVLSRWHCYCNSLYRAHSNDLYIHETNSKIEIYHDNTLHMFCHDSKCLRDVACRIFVTYRDSSTNDGSYELPAYNSCCTLPAGYIQSAVIFDIGR